MTPLAASAVYGQLIESLKLELYDLVLLLSDINLDESDYKHMILFFITDVKKTDSMTNTLLFCVRQRL